MDILQALTEAPSPSVDRRCKVGRWLDGIAEDTPGRPQLVGLIEARSRQDDGYRPIDVAMRVLYRLGFDVSNKVFGDHRGRRCRCFD